MNGLVIGFGEIGQGVYEAFSQYHDLHYIDVIKGSNATRESYDILLVCIPYSEGFIDYVKDYQIMYNPKGTIIFSTVPIGTTRQLSLTVHSPIEGKHPNLAESILKFHRYVGGINQTAVDFFMEAYINPTYFMKPEVTELLKLQSTTNYGINIEYARFVKELCDKYDVDYKFVKDFNTAYNELYEGTGYKRYILDPPKDKIGGHCVVPNAKLLSKSIKNKFLEILEANNG
jgi:hypothetical protein